MPVDDVEVQVHADHLEQQGISQSLLAECVIFGVLLSHGAERDHLHDEGDGAADKRAGDRRPELGPSRDGQPDPVQKIKHGAS